MDVDVSWLLETDYTNPTHFLVLVAVLFIIVFVRYLLLAGIYHWAVYKRFGRVQPYRRLHTQMRLPQVKKEVAYALVGSFIFALSGAVILISWQLGYTTLYTRLTLWDALFIPLCLAAALLLHETYYYWLHRWMHRPAIVHRFHHIHHHSVFTSAFTSFSFHPVEAVLQAVFLPVLVLVLPMHAFVLLGLLLIMSISAVVNHAGIEVFPAALTRSAWGRWLIGATHHDLHHLRFTCNYGLYFTFWDVWMKTEEASYQHKLKALHKRNSEGH